MSDAATKDNDGRASTATVNDGRTRRSNDATPKDPTTGNPPADKQSSGEQKPNPAQQAADERKARRRSWLIRIIFLLVLIAAAIGGVFYWLASRGKESTDDAYTDGRSISMAAKVGGYVTELMIDDNQRVHAGDVLLRIDPRDYQAQRDQAAGQLAVAQAQLANAKVGLEKVRVTAPADLAAAQAQLAQVQAQQTRAQSDYKRQHSVERAATSQENVDASTAALQQTQGQVKAAEAQVQQATLVPQNVAQAEAQVAQLEGTVQQARAQLATAELNLSYCTVTAPQDGTITKRGVERGNYVQPAQVLFSLVTPDLWITANFKEDQLNGMRPGQRVQISVDAFPDLKLEGHVDSVQLGSGARFTAFPPENATGNFVKIVQRVPVKIIIDHGLDANTSLPLGLSVVPTVRVQ